MRIALIGYGKMGREIEAIAREQGDTIAGVFDSKRHVAAEDLSDADVCIEFSTPSAALANIRTAIEARKDIVVGTTGWHQHLAELKEKVRESGLLYSANFSLGMTSAAAMMPTVFINCCLYGVAPTIRPALRS